MGEQAASQVTRWPSLGHAVATEERVAVPWRRAAAAMESAVRKAAQSERHTAGAAAGPPAAAAEQSVMSHRVALAAA